MGTPDIPRLKAKRDARRLKKALEYWPSSDIREQAAQALDEIDWKPADDRQKSCYSLGRRNWQEVREYPRPALSILVKQLQRSEPESKKEAARFLGEIGDSAAAGPLLKALHSAVRFEMENKQSIANSWKTETYEAITKLGKPALDSLDEAIRRLIYSGFHQRSMADKIPHPAMILASPSTSAIQWGYKDYLVTIGNPATPLLIEALFSEKHTSPGFRFMILLTLKGIRDRRAIEPLVTFLFDTRVDNRTRSTAAEVLGYIGGPQVLEPLLRALKDEDHEIRAGAAQGLGHTRSQEATAPLLQALKDSSGSVRGFAAESLGMIGHNRATHALAAIVAQDPESFPRCFAAVALGKIGDAKAAGVLSQALGDKDPDVRSCAKRALELLGKTTTTSNLPNT